MFSKEVRHTMLIDRIRDIGLYLEEDNITTINLYIEELAYLYHKITSAEDPMDPVKQFIIEKIAYDSVLSYSVPNNISDEIIEAIRTKLNKMHYMKDARIAKNPDYNLEYKILIDRNSIMCVKIKKLYKCFDSESEYPLYIRYAPFDNVSAYEEQKNYLDILFSLIADMMMRDIMAAIFLYNGIHISIHKHKIDPINIIKFVFNTVKETVAAIQDLPINQIQEAMKQYIELYQEYRDVIITYGEFEKKRDEIKKKIVELAKLTDIDKFAYEGCKMYSYEQYYFNESAFKKEHEDIYKKYLDKRKIYVVRMT